jgi:Protein of unknown function (DUF3096)
MMRTVAHFMPFVALAGGILILLMPRLLNYVVAIYLILIGAIGLNNIYSLHPLIALTGAGSAERGGALDALDRVTLQANSSDAVEAPAPAGPSNLVGFYFSP